MESKAKKETSKNTVVLHKSGYLTISPELLLPSMGKSGSYYVRPNPDKKLIELKPALNGNGGPWPKRKIIFTNPSAVSPIITIKAALHYIGVVPPEEPAEYKATKKRDGTLIIQF